MNEAVVRKCLKLWTLYKWKLSRWSVVGQITTACSWGRRGGGEREDLHLPSPRRFLEWDHTKQTSGAPLLWSGRPCFLFVCLFGAYLLCPTDYWAPRFSLIWPPGIQWGPAFSGFFGQPEGRSIVRETEETLRKKLIPKRKSDWPARPNKRALVAGAAILTVDDQSLWEDPGLSHSYFFKLYIY